jgi:hypothetical protein
MESARPIRLILAKLTQLNPQESWGQPLPFDIYLRKTNAINN